MTPVIHAETDLSAAAFLMRRATPAGTQIVMRRVLTISA
jgi:hypothetical protein